MQEPTIGMSNKQVFLNSFKKETPTLVLGDSSLEKIAEGHLETLTAIRSGYFSTEDLLKISEEAARKLAKLSQASPLALAWQKVAEDFHSQNYWDFKTQTSKPVKKEKKKKNELVGFIWIAFQAAIIMKVIVLYFGVNAAQQDSDTHYIGLAIALVFSFSALFYFAWRKSKTYKD